MVRNAAIKSGEPEVGECSKHFTFLIDQCGKDDVEDRDLFCRNDIEFAGLISVPVKTVPVELIGLLTRSE